MKVKLKGKTFDRPDPDDKPWEPDGLPLDEPFEFDINVEGFGRVVVTGQPNRQPLLFCKGVDNLLPKLGRALLNNASASKRELAEALYQLSEEDI
jgi:hypothetical protein